MASATRLRPKFIEHQLCNGKNGGASTLIWRPSAPIRNCGAGIDEKRDETQEYSKGKSYVLKGGYISYEAGFAENFPRGGPRASARSAAPTEGMRANFLRSSP